MPPLQAPRDQHRTDRVVPVAIAVFLVVAPFSWILPALGFPLPAYDMRRVLQLGLLCATVAWVVAYRPAREGLSGEASRLPKAARRGLIVVVILGCLSALLAEVPIVAIREVALYLLLFILGITAAASRRRSGEAFEQAVLDAVVIVAIGYLATYLMVAVSMGTGTSLPGFEHPRMFNHAQVLLLPLLVTATTQRPRRSWQGLVLLATLVGWWHLLFVSGSRAAFLAIVVGTVAAALTVGRRSWRWLATYVLSGVSGAIVYGATLFGSTSEVAAYGVRNALERRATLTARDVLWDLAVSYTQEQPLLGIGPGHYAYEPRAPSFAAGPHNIPLQFAAEWGTPVAVVLIVLAAWALGSWMIGQPRASSGPMVRAALTAAMVGAGIDAMFGDSLHAPLAGTVAVLVVGWMFGSFHLHPTLEASDRPWLLRTVLAGSAVLLITTAITTYRGPEATTDDLLRPRFWLNGVVPAADEEP